jgi:twitching motility protein PilT
MAAIDKLLQAAISSQVESVALEPGRLPRFRRAGTEQEVTQTPLDARAIERLLGEVAPGHRMPDTSVVPRWEFDYELDGTTVHFACLANASGWMALASPKLAPAGDRPPPGPLAAPPAPSTDKGRRPLPPVETLMRAMLELGATDLHLIAYAQPHLRLHGELQPFETYEPATSARLKEMLFEIAPERHRAEFERLNNANFSYEIHEVARFRVQLSRDQLGVGAVIRHIPLAVPTVEGLKLPAAAARLAEQRQGLVLVTSPASSGRSTILAALVDRINAQRRCLILTLESPVEFVHARKRSLVRQREIPTHAPTVAAALEEARTENVDVVAIGDLAGRADILAALELAAGGTLVLAGVRASSIRNALAAVAGSGSPGDRGEPGGDPQAAYRLGLIGAQLRGAIGQILLPKVGGGRVAGRELLFTSPAIQKLLREGRLEDLAAAHSRAGGDGSVHQNEILAELVSLAQVGARDAHLAAAEPDAFLERLRVIDPSGKLVREAAAES